MRQRGELWWGSTLMAQAVGHQRTESFLLDWLLRFPVLIKQTMVVERQWEPYRFPQTVAIALPQHFAFSPIMARRGRFPSQNCGRILSLLPKYFVSDSYPNGLCKNVNLGNSRHICVKTQQIDASILDAKIIGCIAVKASWKVPRNICFVHIARGYRDRESNLFSVIGFKHDVLNITNQPNAGHLEKYTRHLNRKRECSR